jgi:hypothetical protein
MKKSTLTTISAAIFLAILQTGCASGQLPAQHTANGVERVRSQDAIVWESAPKPVKICQSGSTVRSC